MFKLKSLFGLNTKLSIGPKIGLIIIGFVLITLFVNHFMKKSVELRIKWENNTPKFMIVENEPQLQEGFLGVVGILDFVMSFYGQLIMTVFLMAIIAIIAVVAAAIPNLRTGIHQHFQCGVTQSDDGYKTGLEVLGIILKCSFDKFVKFFNGQCTFNYFCDMIWGIIFGFIELFFTLIYAICGLDLKFIPTTIYDVVIVPIDTIVYGITGYHIDKWPESIIKKCYRCQGSLNVNGQSYSQFKPINWWANIFTCTNKEIASGTDKIFKSIIPNDYWNTWYNGRHLSGDDWNT